MWDESVQLSPMDCSTVERIGSLLPFETRSVKYPKSNTFFARTLYVFTPFSEGLHCCRGSLAPGWALLFVSVSAVQQQDYAELHVTKVYTLTVMFLDTNDWTIV